MANERIIKDGITTPRILVGDQGSLGSQYGSITYNASNNTIQIASNLQVAGDLHQINTINSTFNDNILTLSKPASGDPIVAPAESGIEVARPGGTPVYASFKFRESSQSWEADFGNGTGIKIITNVSIADIDASPSARVLTTREYLSSKISQAIGNIALNDLNDVTVAGPTNGQMLRYNGSQWVNVNPDAAGIPTLTIVGTGGLISQRRIDASTFSSDSTAPDGAYTAYTSTIATAYPYKEFKFDLVNQPITAGSYINPTLTVNAKGIITGIVEKNEYRSITGNSGNGIPTTPTANLAIVGTGGQITTSAANSGITIGLPNVLTVAPGQYNNANIIVDSTGRVTWAQTGNSGGILRIVANAGGSTDTGQTDILIGGGVGINTSRVSANAVAVNISNTGVGAGSYNYANITVNAQGQITGASTGSPPAITVVNSQSGSYTAPGLGSTLNVTGSNGVTTSMSGNTLNIDASNVNAFETGITFAGNGGWLRFRGGFMIQWGNVNSPGGGTSTIPFPVTFPNACLSLALAARPETSGDDSQPRTSGVNAQPTNSGFSAVWRSGFIRYIAIGY